MVKETRNKGKRGYICELCHLRYLERKWAQACEDWEKKHKSCNLTVIKHAMN